MAVDTCFAVPSPCGSQSPDGCWCDDGCTQYGDCCSDYVPACVDDGNDSGGNDSDGNDSDGGGSGGPLHPYYGGINASLTGDALESALHGLIDGHTVVSYGDLWSAFAQTDGSVPGCNGIYDIYSDVCWNPNSQRCGSYSEEGDCYNREHSWPRSWWGGSSAAQFSDLFHLYPTDGYVNGIRGNLPYCEVSSSSVDYESSNGSRRGNCAVSGFSGEGFEPADAFKGDLARTYFYMAIRYRGEFTCCAEDGVNRAEITSWEEAVLRQWHTADPVSSKEIARNEAVFSLQGNRNPFIDVPAWVDQVFDF